MDLVTERAGIGFNEVHGIASEICKLEQQREQVYLCIIKPHYLTLIEAFQYG